MSTYRYHVPARIDPMPVISLPLLQAAIPVLRRVELGVGMADMTAVRLCAQLVRLLEYAASEPARERHTWPAPNDVLLGGLSPDSFAEVRCEAIIGASGIKDAALVRDGGPCQESGGDPRMCGKVGLITTGPSQLGVHRGPQSTKTVSSSFRRFSVFFGPLLLQRYAPTLYAHRDATPRSFIDSFSPRSIPHSGLTDHQKFHWKRQHRSECHALVWD